jgi:hypothetical protein
MDYSERIIDYLATKTSEKISNQVIRELRKMKDYMLSGDVSPLENTWDEICVQVQHQHSIHWELYLDMILDLTKEKLENFDKKLLMAVWLQTDEGINWIESEEDKDIITYCSYNITEYMLEYVLNKAADYSNKRIQEYLDAQYY